MSSPRETAPAGQVLRIEKAVYGGDGLARTAAGAVALVPFVLPGELVELRGTAAVEQNVSVLEASPDRVEPRCVHFGVCGGCQYQMAAYPAQLSTKEGILRETLARAGVASLPALQVWGSPDPWRYRNRIRLRVREVEGTLRLGYSVRASREFLPITMCPIASEVLWRTAEALLRVATGDRDSAEWLRSAAEVELACDEGGSRVQMHLLCPVPVPTRKGSFGHLAERVAGREAGLSSAGASRLHVASGRATETLASWRADGLAYRVGEESFWLRRGGFFQVNRLLLPQLVDIVCEGRHGALAWDLYAGAGLFARRLAKSFAQVTAVEASPLALAELKRGLHRPGDAAVSETTLAFLQKAVVQRERPDLIVLDPPRAGVGEEACNLLLRLRPAEMVYVSCDPSTLARDAAVLTPGEYTVSELHMMDLFPQTYHLETVMVLRRRDVAG